MAQVTDSDKDIIPYAKPLLHRYCSNVKVKDILNHVKSSVQYPPWAIVDKSNSIPYGIDLPKQYDPPLCQTNPSIHLTYAQQTIVSHKNLMVGRKTDNINHCIDELVKNVRESRETLYPSVSVRLKTMKSVYNHLRLRNDLKMVPDHSIISFIVLPLVRIDPCSIHSFLDVFVEFLKDKMTVESLISLQKFILDKMDIYLDYYFDVYWIVEIFSKVFNSEKIDTLPLSESISSDLRIIIDKQMNDSGYIWNGYFQYVNPNHPVYLAWSGQMSLNPYTFELGVDEDMIHKPIVDDGEVKPEPYNISRYSLGCGWKKADIINSILSSTLSILGREDLITKPCNDKKQKLKPHGFGTSDILRRYLNMSIITGNPLDSNIPLPGFGIRRYESNSNEAKDIDNFRKSKRCLIRSAKELDCKCPSIIYDIYEIFAKFEFNEYLDESWRPANMNKSYFFFIYRLLFRTQKLCTYDNIDKMNLPQSIKSKLLTSMGMNNIISNSNLDQVLSSELIRRRNVKNSLINNINFENVKMCIKPNTSIITHDANSSYSLLNDMIKEQSIVKTNKISKGMSILISPYYMPYHILIEEKEKYPGDLYVKMADLFDVRADVLSRLAREPEITFKEAAIKVFKRIIYKSMDDVIPDKELIISDPIFPNTPYDFTPAEVTDETWFYMARHLVKRMYDKIQHTSIREIFIDVFGVEYLKEYDNFIEGKYTTDNMISTQMFQLCEDTRNNNLDNEYQDITAECIYEVLSLFKCVPNQYYGFMNSRSIFYKTAMGEVPITPEMFNTVFNNRKSVELKLKNSFIEDVGSRETKALSFLSCLTGISTKGDPWEGWTRNALKNTIIDTARRIAWNSQISIDEVLNFSLLYNTNINNTITLPGFYLPFYSQDDHDVWNCVKYGRGDEVVRKWTDKDGKHRKWDENQFDEFKPEFDLILWKTHVLNKAYYICVYLALINKYNLYKNKSIKPI